MYRACFVVAGPSGTRESPATRHPREKFRKIPFLKCGASFLCQDTAEGSGTPLPHLSNKGMNPLSGSNSFPRTALPTGLSTVQTWTRKHLQTMAWSPWMSRKSLSRFPKKPWKIGALSVREFWSLRETGVWSISTVSHLNLIELQLCPHPPGKRPQLMESDFPSNPVLPKAWGVLSGGPLHCFYLSMTF